MHMLNPYICIKTKEYLMFDLCVFQWFSPLLQWVCNSMVGKQDSFENVVMIEISNTLQNAGALTEL